MFIISPELGTSKMSSMKPTHVAIVGLIVEMSEFDQNGTKTSWLLPVLLLSGVRVPELKSDQSLLGGAVLSLPVIMGLQPVCLIVTILPMPQG